MRAFGLGMMDSGPSSNRPLSLANTDASLDGSPREREEEDGPSGFTLILGLVVLFVAILALLYLI